MVSSLVRSTGVELNPACGSPSAWASWRGQQAHMGSAEHAAGQPHASLLYSGRRNTRLFLQLAVWSVVQTACVIL